MATRRWSTAMTARNRLGRRHCVISSHGGAYPGAGHHT